MFVYIQFYQPLTTIHLLYPRKTNVLELVRPCVPTVFKIQICQNTSFFQSAGWDNKSHLVTPLVELLISMSFG